MNLVEKTFLGTFLKASYLIKDTRIRPDHLSEVRHKQLFQKMIEMTEAGKKIDLIALTTLPDLDLYGGMSYLSELESYADIEKFTDVEALIIDQWKEREKKNILNTAFLKDWEISKVIAELDRINEVRIDDRRSISESLVDLYEAPWQDIEPNKGISTGIYQLDHMTNGFQDGELTVIGARPSMGKTDIMLHFALNAGWNKHLPLIFSLEMPEKSLTTRLIAITCGFNRNRLRNPKAFLTEQQKKKWPDVIDRLCQSNIQIFDNPAQSIAEIRAKVRKMINEFPDMKPIVFIDYLTLIQPSQNFGGNAHLQVSEISRNLKMLAKEFSLPVVVLAQLNRSVESRANKRPLMSDIRESGSVEQDADVIIFLYRENYYDKECEDHRLELIVSKNRNGQIGTVNVTYYETTGRIIDEN